MTMGRMLGLVPGIVVAPANRSPFVTQHQPEIRSIQAHSNRVGTFNRRRRRQQLGQQLRRSQQHRHETKQRLDSRERGAN